MISFKTDEVFIYMMPHKFATHCVLLPEEFSPSEDTSLTGFA